VPRELRAAAKKQHDGWRQQGEWPPGLTDETNPASCDLSVSATYKAAEKALRKHVPSPTCSPLSTGAVKSFFADRHALGERAECPSGCSG
jgi:hypothetical protein